MREGTSERGGVSKLTSDLNSTFLQWVTLVSLGETFCNCVYNDTIEVTTATKTINKCNNHHRNYIT